MTLRKLDDFFGLIAKQAEWLPEYMPTKWGRTEPLRNIFNPHDLSGMYPTWQYYIADSIFWKRVGKNQADGAWNICFDFRPETGVSFNHADINLNVYTTKYQSPLMRYFKNMAIKAKANFGYFDASTEQYRPYGMANEFISFGYNMIIITHLLRHWLPDMPWAAVFGPDYIDLFGRDRLLSAPAFKTESLSDEVVFIQLTPDVNDLWHKFDEVMAIREEVKRHLGYECFWQKELAYDWQEHPEKAGQVFRVPSFHFIEDGTKPLWKIMDEERAKQ